MFKTKVRFDQSKPVIPDITKVHRQMLLFRNRVHLQFWEEGPERRKMYLELGEIPIKDGPLTQALKKLVKVTGTGIKLSEEDLELIQTPPEIIDSWGFDEEALISIFRKYTLFDWEREADMCPFCRFSGVGQMKVVSEKWERGGLEYGGVWTYCVHLLFDENYIAI